MRNPNGYGGITKLTGNRRRPYRVRVTVGWRQGAEPGHKIQQFATLGYYATRREALLALAEYNIAPYDAVQRRITFRQVYDQWTPEYFKRYPSTRRVTEGAMEHCRTIWDKPIAELRAAHLQAVISGMEWLSRAYQGKVRTLMHMQYSWCMKNDILQKDYSQYIELTNKSAESSRSVFTKEEIRALWKMWKRGVTPPGEPVLYRGRCMLDSVLVLLYTGLRIGELLALKKVDVDLDRRTIHVHGTKTKAARRLVPVHRAIIPVLERMMAKSPSSLLLSSPENGKLSYSRYKYSWFDRIMAGLKMEHTPHDTRHTFVSGLDTAGVQRSVQKFIVGHSLGRDVTDRYTHKDIAELIRAVDKLKY